MKRLNHFAAAFLIGLSSLIGLATDRAEAADLYSVISADVSNYVGDQSRIDWITQAIIYASQMCDTDPLLITAVMETESRFNIYATSSVGAVGLMQLMPDTASSLGVNPYNQLENIIGGCNYLRQQIARFASWGAYAVTYAVAAYNAGPNAVIKYGGMPPYAETYNYCNAVANNYQKLLAWANA